MNQKERERQIRMESIREEVEALQKEERYLNRIRTIFGTDPSAAAEFFEDMKKAEESECARIPAWKSESAGDSLLLLARRQGRIELLDWMKQQVLTSDDRVVEIRKMLVILAEKASRIDGDMEEAVHRAIFGH